jgi:endo-beta-N-acetylglucosaminidase D
MEWLEFGRWSPEVEQNLAYQAARLSLAAKPTASPSAENTSARARQLEALLKETPASNPWGHPVAEC